MFPWFAFSLDLFDRFCWWKLTIFHCFLF
jgi:hypothetical protein